MKIDLNSDNTIYFKPHRKSFHERNQIKDISHEIKQADVIENSFSQYARPWLIVEKNIEDVRC